MEQKEECLVLYQKLLQLIEEEDQEISRAFQGSLLDAYRSVLKEERNVILRSKESILKI